MEKDMKIFRILVRGIGLAGMLLLAAPVHATDARKIADELYAELDAVADIEQLNDVVFEWRTPVRKWPMRGSKWRKPLAKWREWVRKLLVKSWFVSRTGNRRRCWASICKAAMEREPTGSK